MENGPASRTRSATSEKCVSQSLTPIFAQLEDFVESETDFFRTLTCSPIKNKKVKRKARTPSGQYLSSSVEDIRNFFLQEHEYRQVNCSQDKVGHNKNKDKKTTGEPDDNKELHNHDRNRDYRPNVKVNSCSNNSARGVNQNSGGNNSVRGANQVEVSSAMGSFEKSANLKSVNRDEWTNENINQTEVSRAKTKPSLTTVYQQDHDVQLQSSLLQDRRSLDKLQSDHEKERIYRQERMKKIQEDKETPYKDSENDQEPNKNNMQEQQLENSQDSRSDMMDIKLVYGMFKDLKEDLSNQRILNGLNRLEQLEKRQDKIIDNMMNLQQEVIETKTQVSLLTNTVMHLGEVIDEMESKINQIEYNNMKKSVVTTGLNTEMTKKDAI